MKHHPFNDPCFMQPIIESDTRATKKFLYIFYDFVTRKDTPYAQNLSSRAESPRTRSAPAAFTLTV